MEPYRYFPGTIPLIVSVPHSGTYVPDAILDRFTPEAKPLPDTDWHVDRLYAFVRDMGAHMLVATHSRYVVDLNRDPSGQSLYPGKFTTGLCPTTLFTGSPIYREGHAPDAAEITARTQSYWQPYHEQLRTLIDAQIAQHGRCMLFDAHSIASRVPAFFEGQLPDLNLGTADGATVPAALAEKLISITQNSPYSSVYNGRFKGGYITRHYGNPELGVQAVQMELAQCNYMNESAPYAYDEAKARALQVVLAPLLEALKKEIIQ